MADEWLKADAFYSTKPPLVGCGLQVGDTNWKIDNLVDEGSTV